MDYEKFKEYLKIKQIEEIINDVQDGEYDDILAAKFKHEDTFGNRAEMLGILSRMCEKLKVNNLD